MAVDRRGREMRRHINQIEARRELKQAQERRRRKDSIVAGIVAAAVLALAVALQVFWFSSNPTAAQMDVLEETPGVAETATAAPTANSSNIPDPSIAEGKVFAGTLATSAGDIGVQLDGNVAPQAVAVFTSLAEEGFFQGKTCHRLTTAETMGVLQCGLSVRVNGRAKYWSGGSNDASKYIAIPGGPSFENFELREKYYPGQKFYFGITREEPEVIVKGFSGR